MSDTEAQLPGSLEMLSSASTSTRYEHPVTADVRRAGTGEAQSKPTKMRGVLNTAMSFSSLAAVGASTDGSDVQQPDMQSSTFEYREFKGRERMVDKTIPSAQVGTFVKNLVAELLHGLDSLGAAQIETNVHWPCRWIHMAGLNYAALGQLQELLHLSDEVVNGAKQQRSRPDVSWCPAPRLSEDEPDSPFDHLFVSAQYIQSESGTDECTDSNENVELRAELEKLSLKALRKRAIDQGQDYVTVSSMAGRDEVIDCIVQTAPRNPSVFKYRQVVFVYMPDVNFLLSIDGTGKKNWSNVHQLISNPRCLVRKEQQVTMLLGALIDSMIDEMYPLLDFYAEALSGLDDLIGLQGPERVFVTTSRKLKRRVQSLRRYAWDVRQLLQELRQNQYGVMCTAAKEMMETVEINTNNMVEVSQAYMEQCNDIEQIFDSHQERQLGNFLYVLTIATVTILPIQMMTGIFGMNFEPTMAELKWEYGYHMFWILVITSVLTILICLWRKGWLQKCKELDDHYATDAEKEEILARRENPPAQF